MKHKNFLVTLSRSKFTLLNWKFPLVSSKFIIWIWKITNASSRERLHCVLLWNTIYQPRLILMSFYNHNFLTDDWNFVSFFQFRQPYPSNSNVVIFWPNHINDCYKFCEFQTYRAVFRISFSSNLRMRSTTLYCIRGISETTGASSDVYCQSINDNHIRTSCTFYVKSIQVKHKGEQKERTRYCRLGRERRGF